MSIWFRDRPATGEKRATLDQIIGSLVTGQSTGANVNAAIIENAQQSVAISTAIDMIASIASELPIKYYSGQGERRREIKEPSWLEDPAGDGYGQQDWKYQLVYSWLYRGNIYGEVLGRTREGAGYINQMSLWHPDAVSGNMLDGRVVWTADGQEIPAGRMYHKRVNPVPGVIQGQSMISRNATQIGISLASTRFGKSWFDSDANPSGILRNTMGAVDADKARTARDRFMAALRGTREPIVMGRGWEWQTISITPEESQFLQTMGWSEAQCARLFGPGVPQLLGYETGGSLTYANIQDFDITFLKYAMDRWLKRVERVISDFLPNPQFAEISRDALLQSSTYQRYQAYALALQGAAWKEVNEVRELENLAPIVVEEPAPDPVPDDEDPAAEAEPDEDPEEDTP